MDWWIILKWICICKDVNQTKKIMMIKIKIKIIIARFKNIFKPIISDSYLFLHMSTPSIFHCRKYQSKNNIFIVKTWNNVIKIKWLLYLMMGSQIFFWQWHTNHAWIEITFALDHFQTPQDHPDLLTRVFRSKFE